VRRKFTKKKDAILASFFLRFHVLPNKSQNKISGKVKIFGYKQIGNMKNFPKK
jgi:hypothetical protein